jgi:hypothetical protein
MQCTYSGFLEGSLEVMSKFVLEHLSERAAEILPPATPLAVVKPPPGPLPEWMCVAALGSLRGVHHSDPDFRSFLYACWFMKDTSASLDAIIESILPYLDWEQIAEDYDVMDF